ncbi:virulence factor esxB [Staphylococcus aureus F53399]|nr:virulence factor esxB [Staphylococcus aureus SJOS6106]EVC28307.1 virulence factor esxB [Staphylococcus aureus SJOS6071]EVF61957.1 virulence factor esxB [Staphylococcus aureus SJUD6021]EVI17139.1 virulence factor esxB [Staphylococcus aureus AGEN6042]EVI42166.1 virulence factor esxB [Staphylococcus aureus UCIM6115]EVJ39744.1 virulence factor esxB [Staphylococcus aureus HBHO6024]EWJ44334.1 virulence factor esxB [Staphylococcus aureus H87668]EWV15002.1 virulence factor esxB [Staphylococcus au
MGGYKGIKADGGKVNQAKQLAAKIAKDIVKHVKSKRNSSLSISKVVIGKDSSPIR